MQSLDDEYDVKNQGWATRKRLGLANRLDLDLKR